MYNAILLEKDAFRVLVQMQASADISRARSRMWRPTESRQEWFVVENAALSHKRDRT